VAMEMEMAGKVAVKVSKIAGHIFYSHHLAGQAAHPLILIQIQNPTEQLKSFCPPDDFMLLDYLFELMCGLRFSVLRCLTRIYKHTHTHMCYPPTQPQNAEQQSVACFRAHSSWLSQQIVSAAQGA